MIQRREHLARRRGKSHFTYIHVHKLADDGKCARDHSLACNDLRLREKKKKRQQIMAA